MRDERETRHLIPAGLDPRDMRVLSLERCALGYLSRVRVQTTLPVWITREGLTWVAVAAIP